MPPRLLAWAAERAKGPFRKTVQKAGGGGNQEFWEGQGGERNRQVSTSNAVLWSQTPHLAFREKVQHEGRRW